MFKKCSSSIYLSVLLILSIGLCTSLAIQDRERLLYQHSQDQESVETVLHLLPRHLAKRFAPQVNTQQQPPGGNGTAESKDRQVGGIAPLLHAEDSARTKDNANATPKDSSSQEEGENRSDSSNSSAGGGSTPVGGDSQAPVRDNHQPPSRPQQPTSQPQEASTTAGTPNAQHEQQMVGVNGTGIRWTNVTLASGGAVPKDGKALQHPTPVVSEPLDPNNRANLPDDLSNTTLAEHNITQNKTDSHEYYNSTISVSPDLGKMYWDEFSSPEKLNAAQVSELLSSSHRRAVTVQLKFPFPFYGHSVRNVTVATGGFLYTGDYVHSWLAATQYIAPLMANFDTSISNSSLVKFYDNGTAFTVLWENVYLQDRPEVGPFTFSATLMDTGDIIFVYKNIPVLVEKIEDNKHPVKVGLSDAYIIDRTVFFTRRKTIYEYHRVQFKQEDIRNGTTIYLKLLPTCVSFNDCQSCLNNHTGFVCAWCPATNRCSSGLDRYRQEWLSKGCNLTGLSKNDQCPAVTSPPEPHDSTEHSDEQSQKATTNESGSPSPKAAGHRSPSSVTTDNGELDKEVENTAGHGALAALIPLCLIVAIAGWLLYAYRNPHTKSGQMLIRYRPSQWTWRRGEARYTAATIHM